MTVSVNKFRLFRNATHQRFAEQRSLCAFFLAVLVSFSIFSALVPATSVAAVQWGKRYALIIGNSNYKSIDPLPNPARDAGDIALALKRLKFDVTVGTDLTNAQLAALLAQFKTKLKDADTVLFYYAGHGFQLNGSNFLVPVDARLENRDTLAKETTRLNSIIAALNGRKHQTIVLLDACRNNPLPLEARREGDRQGLAQVQTGNGTFIAFSTQPGNITRDGRGRNSPFTLALLTHINQPKTSISDLMINVRNEVNTETLGTQTPWDQSSLRTQFYFNPNDRWTSQTASLQPSQNAGQNGLFDTGRSIGLSQTPTSGPGLIISGSGPAVPVTPANPPTAPPQEIPRAKQKPEISFGPETTTDLPRRPAPPQPQKPTVTASLPPQFQPPIRVKPIDQRAVAIRVQRNLQRLGCMAPGRATGNWDAKSEIALGSYYRARQKSIESLSPSEELARTLELQSGIVCIAPVIKPKHIVKRPPPSKIIRPKKRRPNLNRPVRPARKKLVKARPSRPAKRRPVAKKKKIKLKGIFR